MSHSRKHKLPKEEIVKSPKKPKLDPIHDNKPITTTSTKTKKDSITLISTISMKLGFIYSIILKLISKQITESSSNSIIYKSLFWDGYEYITLIEYGKSGYFFKFYFLL